jgi:phosphatidylserine decarboxylase
VIIAREGWSIVGVGAAVTVVLHWALGAAWAWPLWLVLFFVIQFFRDPPREISQTVGAIVSPAHGKVVAIARVRDPYLDRDALKVSIFMNVFSVHSNRIPMAGEIRGQWYHAGRFFNAALDKASRENERNALWVQTPTGEDIVVVQIAGLIARRISCDIKHGERVTTGQRYGFIKFGSRVDVYLPLEADIATRLGQWVLSGTDTIAYLRSR